MPSPPQNANERWKHGSFYTGELEIRATGRHVRTLFGRFPYNVTATTRAVGRQRKERFKSGSLSWQVREFQELQARIPEVIESALDKARKQILHRAARGRTGAAQHVSCWWATTTTAPWPT